MVTYSTTLDGEKIDIKLEDECVLEVRRKGKSIMTSAIKMKPGDRIILPGTTSIIVEAEDERTDQDVDETTED